MGESESDPIYLNTIDKFYRRVGPYSAFIDSRSNICIDRNEKSVYNYRIVQKKCYKKSI